MPDSLRDALRERLTAGAALGSVALLAVWIGPLDASLPQLATTVATGLVMTLTDAAGDAYDLRESVEAGGIGLIAVLGGTALLAFGDGSAWLPVALLSVGAWFLLDAVQTVRHEGATVEAEAGADARDGRAVYRNYVARRVHETLDAEARTRRELREALDADAGAVDAAVATLRERGVVTVVGSELRVTRSDPTRRERFRRRLGAAATRLARPVALEFDSDAATERPDPTTDRSDDRSPGRDRRASDDRLAERRSGASPGPNVDRDAVDAVNGSDE
jgi:hypothetical protein